MPDSSASTVTRPNGSSHCAGFHTQRARASNAALRLPSTSPTYRTPPVKLGRQPPATTSLCPIPFAASTAQWYPFVLCRRPRKRSNCSGRFGNRR